MGSEESHALGYERVDDDPNLAVLLGTMDTTARWEATGRLRKWEREQLCLRGRQRLLDVGCGLGEAALALADDLASTIGLEVLARTQATQNWTAWNPDESPAPDGCFSMESLADGLVAADQLALGDPDRFVATIHDAARRGQFSMTLSMHAVVARAPTPKASVGYERTATRSELVEVRSRPIGDRVDERTHRPNE